MPSAAQMVNNPLAVVMDERLSRERALLLTQLVSGLRQLGRVELMKSDTPDTTLQQKLAASPELRLVLPWDRYARSLRLEPADRIAGYFSETIGLPQLTQEFTKSSGSALGRHILLDWNTASVTPIAQIVHWTGLWLNPGVSTGIRPMVKPESLIYCENWLVGAGMGFRLDQAQAAIETLVPENKTRWQPHLPRVRSILCDLWSTVYEFGPGRVGTNQQTPGPLAYFQLSGHADLLVFRLQFPTTSTHAAEVLGELSPFSTPKAGSEKPPHAAHRLYREADFFRVNFFKENPSIELTVALRWNTPLAPIAVPTLKPVWLAQTPLTLLKEPPFEAPSPQEPRLRVLPSSGILPRDISVAPAAAGDSARDRKMQEAALLVQKLRGDLKQKDETISELRMGGVGTSQPLPPPDAQGLLLAFQQRYFEMNLSIRKLEAQIHQLSAGQALPAQLEPVKRKLQLLQTQEQEWLTTLSETLGRVRSAKAK